MQTLTRRNFLESTLRSGLALTGLGLLDPAHLGAIEPFKRAGAPRLLLSLAAYSFREYFKENNRKSGGAEPGKRIDLFQFVDYCAEHGCQGAELTSYYFPPAAGPDFLIQIFQKFLCLIAHFVNVAPVINSHCGKSLCSS